MRHKWFITILTGFIASFALNLAHAKTADTLGDHLTSFDFLDAGAYDFDVIDQNTQYEPITETSYDKDFDEYALSVQRRPATGRTTFIFSPKKLRWYAYDRSGHLVGSGRASGGKGYCRDVKRRCTTPVGTFTVYSKGSSSCKSSK